MPTVFKSSAHHNGMPDQEEARFPVDLAVRVFGMDAKGHPFSQIARARNISDHGARLSGLETRLNLGEIIGVQLGDNKAHCKVIWVGDAGPPHKIEVGCQILEGQPCPWEKQRTAQRGAGVAPTVRTAPAAKEKRKFSRHRIPFPLEIKDAQSVGSHILVRTADIAGSGCYVETLVPLPVKKTLTITFWLNSERVQTSGVVRTSDGGVGMGIEFTGLDEATQQRLQQQLENLASPFKKAQGTS